MSLVTESRFVNALNTRTSYKEGNAKILQLRAEKEFSPDHRLVLAVYKTSLYEGCLLSSKLLPLVVAMWENKVKDRYNDFYSFDNNGVCLSHGYSWFENGKYTANEQHDNDISRLLKHGANIREMIENYPVGVPLAIHTTVIDLMNNMLIGQRKVLQQN
ncbi:MAG: hypothetical protein AABX48_02245 [Nanoarchaeota archaeon]